MGEEFAKFVTESAHLFDKSQAANAEQWVKDLLERSRKLGVSFSEFSYMSVSDSPSTSQVPVFGKVFLEAARRKLSVDDFSRTINSVDSQMGGVLGPVYEVEIPFYCSFNLIILEIS